jgi:hypothetical protein
MKKIPIEKKLFVVGAVAFAISTIDALTRDAKSYSGMSTTGKVWVWVLMGVLGFLVVRNMIIPWTVGLYRAFKKIR